MIVLYTDGITEAVGPAAEEDDPEAMFGEEALDEVLRAQPPPAGRGHQGGHPGRGGQPHPGRGPVRRHHPGGDPTAGLRAGSESIWPGRGPVYAVRPRPDTSTTSGDDSCSAWLKELLPILILLVVVAVVFMRLPTVDVGHDKAYLRRRVMNWLPLGLTYAFLYMGRYNLKVSKFAFEEIAGPDGSPLMGNAGFGIIFMVGHHRLRRLVPDQRPADRPLGGRFSILMGAGGAMVVNLLMGLASLTLLKHGPAVRVPGRSTSSLVFSVLYAVNMYFQSFGAVAIVKVNAPWFHVRERGRLRRHLRHPDLPGHLLRLRPGLHDPRAAWA